MPFIPALIMTLMRGLSAFSFKSFFLILFGMMAMKVIPKILVGLGLGFVTYKLGGFALDAIYLKVTDSFTGLPADSLTMLKIAKIDEFLSIVFGAVSARMVIAGFNSKFAVFS